MGSTKRTLEILQEYYAARRAMPSFAALAKLAGLSVSTISDIVHRLKGYGFLDASETGRLEPGKRFFERQLLGAVQAGLPTPAEDALPEGFLIDEYLVDAPTRTMVLTVRGESMRDAGLLSGDMVIVKRGALPRPGDIVVARLAGEFTVKELATGKGGQPFLRARNPDFMDVQLVEDCEIIGVVTGQFRRYSSPANAAKSESVKSARPKNVSAITAAITPDFIPPNVVVGGKADKRAAKVIALQTEPQP